MAILIRTLQEKLALSLSSSFVGCASHSDSENLQLLSGGKFRNVASDYSRVRFWTAEKPLPGSEAAVFPAKLAQRGSLDEAFAEVFTASISRVIFRGLTFMEADSSDAFCSLPWRAPSPLPVASCAYPSGTGIIPARPAILMAERLGYRQPAQCRCLFYRSANHGRHGLRQQRRHGEYHRRRHARCCNGCYVGSGSGLTGTVKQTAGNVHPRWHDSSHWRGRRNRKLHDGRRPS